MSGTIDLPSGDVYKDSYEEKKELGRGKFGVVFQVEEKATNKIFAAKHIKTNRKDQKDKVMEEIKILEKLSDPQIIGFIGAYENSREIIVVMEYLDGGDLFEKVAEEEFQLTEADCCHYLRQICMGVQYLCENSIVHLDLKTHAMCGTLEFLAPEVVNYDAIDTATDLWSVGVLCYILLSGYSPFLGDTEADTSANITRGTFDFDCDEFDIISENGKDFITQLLKNKMSKRMTASQCLDHGWLLEQNIGHHVINTENLRKFMARRRWQAIRAVKKMSGLLLRKRSTQELLTSLSSPPDSPDISNMTEKMQLEGLSQYGTCNTQHDSPSAR
eukprot:GFUD01131530.1.p1 GENE.GFUD01131530.1~~GFUD01131530.1.p1  ORF type:complete len:330 (-),score=76.47 GFUD01131530.1:85-1074(-)